MYNLKDVTKEEVGASSLFSEGNKQSFRVRGRSADNQREEEGHCQNYKERSQIQLHPRKRDREP